MKNKILSIFLLFTTDAFSQGKSDKLILLLNGEEHKSIEMSAIREMKPSVVEFYDLAYRKSDTFKGVPFVSLFSSFFPSEIKKAVEIELISLNGYKTYIPIENFYKVDSYLTYESTIGKFERFSLKEKQIVHLGPYYLVWDFKTIGKEDRFQYNSVYQINKINLITNAVEFLPQDVKKNETIDLGYRTYKKYCLSCHAIDTWGGNISVDLIKKKTLEIKGADYIVKYALDPKSINPKTKMRPLPKYKNSEAMAKGVAEFLKFATNPTIYMKKPETTKVRYESLKIIMDEMSKEMK
jgi:hypothetical protein